MTKIRLGKAEVWLFQAVVLDQPLSVDDVGRQSQQQASAADVSEQFGFNDDNTYLT